jgi:hypothetical protein
MAKDILAIPISGVGVERIFSITRQICSYQQNRLDADTIKQLMIVRTYDRLMAPEDSDNMLNPTALKEKMGFSKIDYTIAQSQRIPVEEATTTDSTRPSAQPASTHRTGGRSQKGPKRQHR